MTAVLHELRESLTLTREVYGRRSSQSQRAFELLVRTAAANGTPLDGLRHHVEDEVERFFSYTIPGPDGHVYWDGPKVFVRNDGKGRRPLRWWWQHRYANLLNNDDLVLKCGERNCINPEHASKEYLRGFRMRWSRERMLARLQVVALQKGRTPTTTEWAREKRHPVAEMYTRMFGDWAQAVAAAGLSPTRGPGAAADKPTVIAGIRLVRKLFGRWPSDNDYVRYRTELLAARLPSTVAPATRLFGSFPAARVAAGGPASLLSEAQQKNLRAHLNLDRTVESEACLDGIRFVKARIGHWPTLKEYVAAREALAAAGLPTSDKPARHIFGSFPAARYAAGGPPLLPPGRRPQQSADPTEPESSESKRKDQ